MVKYLVENGANVNAKDSDNDSALIIASKRGHN
jgi:ankyrin repeat protein